MKITNGVLIMGQPQYPGSGQGGDPGRDRRLGWFASGGRFDKSKPSAEMGSALEAVTGSGSRPPSAATDDEVTGIMGCWQALGAHAEAGMLAAVREIIRRRAPRVKNGKAKTPVAMYPGDLPAEWGIGIAHEAAAALGISWQAADAILNFAFELEARLPGVGQLLDDGVITPMKAKIVVQELSLLDDEKIAEAEKLLLEHDFRSATMTPGKIRLLCQRLVDTVDPEGSRKRREEAEREDARVRFFRSHGGAGSMFASGLPADEALMSESNIQKRAREYHDAGIDEQMDLLRVLALVDSINGRALDERVALWHAEQAARTGEAADAEEAPRDGNATEDGDATEDGRASLAKTDDPDDAGDPPPDDGQHGGDGGPGGSGGPGRGSGSGGPGGGDRGDRGDGGDLGGVPTGTPDPGLPSLVNLTLPLADLLDRRAQQPGEASGYGSLDPALVRQLAQAVIKSARSRFCITLTDWHGHATAHGCARLIPENPTTREIHSSRDGPPFSGWDLAPDDTRPGPDGGYGAWILTLPGGRRYRVEIHKISLHDCDHTYETDSYRPGALLRHLVQVRDGECTFTGCARPARESDFEHAVPYDEGGRTDLCNAGARSRRCHQVKQLPGWTVTQPEPGWHKWTAPSGRSYTKGPKQYPA